MTYDAFDVVRVPFPFTDKDAIKRRPALVLSRDTLFNSSAGHSVMAMITSSDHVSWPLDCPIEDLAAAGLPAPSKVRFKLFTLDHRLVLNRLGQLSDRDRSAVRDALNQLLDTAR